MADGRMKAVAEDDGGGDDEIGRGDESDEEEEFDELELGLSLGRYGWKGRKMAGRQVEEESREFAASQWEHGGGSSRHFERQEMLRPVTVVHPYRQWEEDTARYAFRPLLGDTDLQDDTFLELERASFDGDRDMDMQNKRAKVFTPSEVSSSLAAEMDIQLASVDHVDHRTSLASANEMSYYMNLFPDDGTARRNTSYSPMEMSEDAPNTRSTEDAEIRMDFSDDLLHLIFSFLGQRDLCRAGAACKQWLAASTHEDFWRCLKFENTRVSPQNFAAICHRYPNATEVRMFCVPHSDLLALEAMSSLRHLETLNLGKGQFGEGFFHALTDCPALISLKICDAHLGNGIQEVIVNHERLCDLHISKCRALRISVRCPQLRKLSLKRTNMAHISLACPQLADLDFSSCHKLSDTAIRQAATACPLLSALDISSCSCVSDETVRDISLACPSLSVLDASHCPNISFESVRLPMLTNLQLQSCEGITTASVSAISHSRLLEALHLQHCGLLTSISLDLPHLRSITLVYLRKFVDLNLRSPALQSITVSRCMALGRISITSNALQKLVLQKQESLSTLLLQCNNLQEVDLSDCDSLTNSICGVFSDGGGCPMLRSLVLDNCEKLSVVGLNSSCLIRLSLAGCRALTFLELSCPNLEEIYLDGCDHLEKASFCPVGLESLNLGICPKLSVLQIEAPKMSILELKGCGMLSQASICCPCLISLDASFCRQLVDESLSTTAASCPNIEFLVLSSCLFIGFDGLSSLHWLRRLTLLDLSYTFLTNLQPVFDTCSQLVILKLSACKYLTDSSLDALYEKGALPALNELDLSYSSIGQYSIAKLLAYCTNLVHVNLNGCANMQALVWGSSDCHASDVMVDACLSNSNSMETNIFCLWKSRHLLEILNCTGCPNIKRVHIPSIANCIHLSKINLNLSANLKEVDLTCTNLATLNLSYCSSLEILKLDCPRLNSLQLQACIMLEQEELEAAIAQCKMLEILNIHSCPKLYSEDFERLRFICPSLKRIQNGPSL